MSWCPVIIYDVQNAALRLKIEERVVTFWNQVTTEEDISALNGAFGDFHDSILREGKFCNGVYIDDSLCLVESSEAFFRCVFQRQRGQPTAIELVFTGVSTLQLNTSGEPYEEAFIYLEGDELVWSELPLKEDALRLNKSYIKARRLSWRVVDHWIGRRERYTAVCSEDLEYYDPEPEAQEAVACRLPGRRLDKQ